AGPGTPGVLHPLPGPTRGLERGAGAILVLGNERGVDADDSRASVPAGSLATGRRGYQRILACTVRMVPKLSVAVVGADAGGRGSHVGLGASGLADPQGSDQDKAGPGAGGQDGDRP